MEPHRSSVNQIVPTPSGNLGKEQVTTGLASSHEAILPAGGTVHLSFPLGQATIDIATECSDSGRRILSIKVVNKSEDAIATFNLDPLIGVINNKLIAHDAFIRKIAGTTDVRAVYKSISEWLRSIGNDPYAEQQLRTLTIEHLRGQSIPTSEQRQVVSKIVAPVTLLDLETGLKRTTIHFAEMNFDGSISQCALTYCDDSGALNEPMIVFNNGLVCRAFKNGMEVPKERKEFLRHISKVGSEIMDKGVSIVRGDYLMDFYNNFRTARPAVRNMSATALAIQLTLFKQPIELFALSQGAREERMQNGTRIIEERLPSGDSVLHFRSPFRGAADFVTLTRKKGFRENLGFGTQHAFAELMKPLVEKNLLLSDLIAAEKYLPGTTHFDSSRAINKFLENKNLQYAFPLSVEHYGGWMYQLFRECSTKALESKNGAVVSLVPDFDGQPDLGMSKLDLFKRLLFNRLPLCIQVPDRPAHVPSLLQAVMDPFGRGEIFLFNAIGGKVLISLSEGADKLEKICRAFMCSMHLVEDILSANNMRVESDCTFEVSRFLSLLSDTVGWDENIVTSKSAIESLEGERVQVTFRAPQIDSSCEAPLFVCTLRKGTLGLESLVFSSGKRGFFGGIRGHRIEGHALSFIQYDDFLSFSPLLEHIFGAAAKTSGASFIERAVKAVKNFGLTWDLVTIRSANI